MLYVLAQEAVEESSLVTQIQGRGLELFQAYGVPAISALLILFVGYLLSGWAANIVLGSCNKAKLDLTIGKFFSRMAKWGVLLLTGIFVLGKFGIETASFAVILGAAGLAIGLAFSGTLSNFASGIMLLIFRPYKVGDVVNVAGQTGKIDELELFTTTMDTPDNRRIIIPNTAIFGAVIENITHHSTRRVDVNVGASYDADIDKTREVLTAAAKSVEGVLDTPDIQILLKELGGSSVDWVVRVWCNTADYWTIREAVIRAIKMHLDEANIGIPYPQMDVHLDKVGE